MAELRLGNTYKDKVTGVFGVAIILHHHVSGRQQVTLQPKALDSRTVLAPVTAELIYLEEVDGEGNPVEELLPVADTEADASTVE